MANEKILNTRLQLKYDTYENWYASSIILKEGEVAIATVANNTTNATGTKFQNLPNIVLKVGNGTDLYKDLKFVSALAADVHEWAKAADKPTYTYADIQGLEDYIRSTANNEIKNTDTQYNLVAVDAANYKYELRSKGLEDASWTKVADLDLSGLVSRVAALEGLVGTEKVSKQISDAIGAITVAATEAGQGEIISSVAQDGGSVVVAKRTLVKEDIPVIEQTQVNGLDTALANAAKAGTDAADQALEDANVYTDEKIGAIGYADPTYAEGQFVTKVTQSGGFIEVERAAVGIANVTGLQTKLGEIDEDLTALDANKQDKLTFTSTPGSEEGHRVVTEDYVAEKVRDLTGAMHFEGRYDALPEATQFQAGDVVIVPSELDENTMVEYVMDNSGKWQKLGDESMYEIKSEAKASHEALQKAIDDGLAELDAAKQDNLDFKTAPSAANPVMTEDDVDTAVSGAIDAINVTGETVAKGEIIESVKQEHGALVVTKRALKGEDIPVIEQAQVNGLGDALAAAAKAGTDAAAEALADAQEYADAAVETAVNGLTKPDAAVELNVVTAVAQDKGVIEVTRAPLSKLAFTGNVNDLVQDEGDVLVFYCGTASTVI